MPDMTCSACGAENRAGRKFCSNCGAPLALACPSCGAANEPGDRFCGACGGPLTTAPPVPAAATERRLVSVLFADLVGFTSHSDARDPEEVRELLTGYFDAALQAGRFVPPFSFGRMIPWWIAAPPTNDTTSVAANAGQ